MKNRSRLIRKITNLLGITFISLGMIPVPVLSQIGSAYARVEDGAAAIALPTSRPIVNCWRALLRKSHLW